MINPYLILGAVTICLTIGGIGYWKGKEDGKVQQLKDSAAALRTRGDVNKNIKSMDEYHLCITLGGLPEHCS